MMPAFLLAALLPMSASAQDTVLSRTEGLPPYLRDRGEGIPLSMFGTYVRAGEIVFYPFYEYYYDRNAQYEPAEFGHGLKRDFSGKYVAHEGLVFLGYGVSDRLALEFEAAVIAAELEKDPADPSTMPARVKETGLGDVEGQVRWRWNREDENRPEVFNYFETVLPLQRDKDLIGTQAWEFKLGVGAVKGFRFGTLTARLSAEYDRGEDKVEVGEMAFEYLKKLSRSWRLYAAVEGAPDDLGAIGELQWHFARNAYLKAGSGFGISAQATDIAPEVGVAFLF